MLTTRSRPIMMLWGQATVYTYDSNHHLTGHNTSDWVGDDEFFMERIPLKQVMAGFSTKFMGLGQ